MLTQKQFKQRVRQVNATIKYINYSRIYRRSRKFIKEEKRILEDTFLRYRDTSTSYDKLLNEEKYLLFRVADYVGSGAEYTVAHLGIEEAGKYSSSPVLYGELWYCVRTI